MLSFRATSTQSNPNWVGVVFLIVTLAAAYGAWCHLIGKTAARNGSSYAGWFLLAMLVSPLVVSLLAARQPRRVPEDT